MYEKRTKRLSLRFEWNTPPDFDARIAEANDICVYAAAFMSVTHPRIRITSRHPTMRFRDDITAG